jgi:hypothetical protein
MKKLAARWAQPILIVHLWTGIECDLLFPLSPLSFKRLPAPLRRRRLREATETPNGARHARRVANLGLPGIAQFAVKILRAR